ncbi:MAG TPA: GDP-mannose 4,6-dehydratase, partial [Candidatus Norongarragalinales archaeon]|nr:GDP-mannose 4,6-dehydratase [Candidatus Norongarragalinales archaeon]
VLKGQPVEIYGSGRQTRQFTFVDDTVDATLKAWKSEKACGEIFNVASPRESSVLEIAKTVEKISGKKADLKFLPAIQGDPMKNEIDVLKAKKILGFQASRSLEEGLRETILSFK